MRSDKVTGRWVWTAAAVAVIGAAVVVRELLRSGTVADGLLDHWWGDVGMAAMLIAAVGTGLYFLHRAYRD